MACYEDWMRQALLLARQAARVEEVPVGCIIVNETDGGIVGRGFNLRESACDPTAHAEIVALRQAGRNAGLWRLADCTLVVTLEPCIMCAGAIVNARVRRVVYGCDDPRAGAVRTLYRVCDDRRLNHRVEVIGGVLADECAALLRDFFRERRTRTEQPAPDDRRAARRC